MTFTPVSNISISVDCSSNAGARDGWACASRASRAELPGYFDAGDVFAMPCRTRRRGLDVEGLGMVFLEAAATGLPVVGGDSGNSADAIRDGETGYVVPGVSVADLADRLKRLLTDPCAAKAMGDKGLAWVHQEWRWEIITQRFAEIVAGG